MENIWNHWIKKINLSLLSAWKQIAYDEIIK